ncbi:MAG: hypothetical protein ACREBR_01725 [bacterium]
MPTSTSGKETTTNLRKESNAAHPKLFQNKIFVPPNVKRIYSIKEKGTGAVPKSSNGG